MIGPFRAAIGSRLRALLSPGKEKRSRRRDGKEVIQGSAGNVIIVKSPNTEYFKEAIFILCDDLFTRRGVSSAQILRQARREAWEYTAAHAPPSSITLLTRLLYFLLGAAAGLIAAFFLL
jgi:hypothetical protein